jgi:hypothetical protein
MLKPSDHLPEGVVKTSTAGLLDMTEMRQIAHAWPPVSTPSVTGPPHRPLGQGALQATAEDIAARHTESEITGPAEVRTPSAARLTRSALLPHAELKRLREPAPQINPHRDRPPAVDYRRRMLPDRAVPSALRDLLRSPSSLRARCKVPARYVAEISVVLDSLTTSRT